MFFTLVSLIFLTVFIFIQLKSIPGLASERIQVNLMRDPVPLDPPTVDWNCSGKIDNETGLYTLQFEFSYNNVSLIQEAIQYYEISVGNMNGLRGDIRILRETIDIERVQVNVSNILLY